MGQHVGGLPELGVVRSGHLGQGPNLNLGQGPSTVALCRATAFVEAERGGWHKAGLDTGTLGQEGAGHDEVLKDQQT